jgi:hypothetical protein
METIKVMIFDALGVQPKHEVRKDGFAESTSPPSSSSPSTPPSSSPSFLSGFSIVIVIIIFLSVFLYSFGAAKLSWCYNSSQGTGTALKLLYAILAYFFSAMYYPFYAFALDDNCQMPAPRANLVGGRRRK